MTVAELIDELKKMQPHHPVKVVVAGSDGGCCIAEDCGFRRDSAEGDLRDVSFQGNHIRLEAD